MSDDTERDWLDKYLDFVILFLHFAFVLCSLIGIATVLGVLLSR